MQVRFSRYDRARSGRRGGSHRGARGENHAETRPHCQHQARDQHIQPGAGRHRGLRSSLLLSRRRDSAARAGHPGRDGRLFRCCRALRLAPHPPDLDQCDAVRKGRPCGLRRVRGRDPRGHRGRSPLRRDPARAARRHGAGRRGGRRGIAVAAGPRQSREGSADRCQPRPARERHRSDGRARGRADLLPHVSAHRPVRDCGPGGRADPAYVEGRGAAAHGRCAAGDA